jgi:hypothetical protein
MEQFPPNSRKERVGAREPSQVAQVTSGTARRRRRPLGKQFKSTFFSGDARGAVEYMFFEIAIPEFKNMLVDAVSAGFERLVQGDRGPRRRRPGFMSSYVGNMTNYGGVSRGMQRPDDRPPMPNRMVSRQARARHDFGEILLETRQDAEEVLDRMYDILAKHNEVQVSDLYALTGMESTHVDTKWGWTDLHGSKVGRIRGGGYILELPEPEILK